MALGSSSLLSPVSLPEWRHDTAVMQITLHALAACEDDIPAGMLNSCVVSCQCACVCVGALPCVSKWWCHYWHRRFPLDKQEQWIPRQPAYAAKLGPGTAGHTEMLPGFWEQMPLEQQRLYPWPPHCIAFHLCVPNLYRVSQWNLLMMINDQRLTFDTAANLKIQRMTDWKSAVLGSHVCSKTLPLYSVESEVKENRKSSLHISEKSKFEVEL